MDKLRKTGQAIIENNKLIAFKEKPQVNISNNACPPFYIINKNDLGYIKNIDVYYESLGDLIEYLSDKIEIKCYKMIGKRIDIGSQKLQYINFDFYDENLVWFFYGSVETVTTLLRVEDKIKK